MFENNVYEIEFNNCLNDWSDEKGSTLYNEAFCAKLHEDTIRGLFGNEEDNKVEICFDYLTAEKCEEVEIEKSPEDIVANVQPMPVIIEQKKRRGRPPIEDLEEKNRRLKANARKAAKKYRKIQNISNKSLDQKLIQLNEENKSLRNKFENLEIKHKLILSICVKNMKKFNKTNSQKILRIQKKYSKN